MDHQIPSSLLQKDFQLIIQFSIANLFSISFFSNLSSFPGLFSTIIVIVYFLIIYFIYCIDLFIIIILIQFPNKIIFFN